MSECDKITVCPFFNDKLSIMPGMASVYKEKYCKGTFMTCARHIVAMGKGNDAVPLDLYPHQAERTRTLLK